MIFNAEYNSAGMDGDLLFFLIAIVVIDAHHGAGEGERFTEGDEDGFMDLSGGVDIHSAEEEYHADNRESRGGKQLYERGLFHKRIFRLTVQM